MLWLSPRTETPINIPTRRPHSKPRYMWRHDSGIAFSVRTESAKPAGSSRGVAVDAVLIAVKNEIVADSKPAPYVAQIANPKALQINDLYAAEKNYITPLQNTKWSSLRRTHTSRPLLHFLFHWQMRALDQQIAPITNVSRSTPGKYQS